MQQTRRARLVCVAALASDSRVERQVRYEVILMEVVHAGTQVAGDEPAGESPGIQPVAEVGRTRHDFHVR